MFDETGKISHILPHPPLGCESLALAVAARETADDLVPAVVVGPGAMDENNGLICFSAHFPVALNPVNYRN
jgi:hypothetical protein